MGVTTIKNKIMKLGTDKIAVSVKRELLDDLSRLSSDDVSLAEVLSKAEAWDNLDHKFKLVCNGGIDGVLQNITQYGLLKLVEVPEVKQCVADWYENNKKELDNKIWLYCNEWGRHDRRDPFYQWFNDTKNNPIGTLIRMKDGYTVVKEPLYYVVFNKLGSNHRDCYLWIDEPNNGYVYFSDKPDMGKNKFTEKQIKAIDERYWAFAVPVEEEEK